MKKLFVCISMTAALAGCMAISVDELQTDTTSAHAFQRACEKTAIDYAWHWDHFNASEFAALFTPDAHLQVPGNSLDGRDAILQHQQTRPQNFVMRHVVSNVRFEQTAETTAEGQVYVTVYGKRIGEDGDVAVEGMLALAEYHDQYQLIDGRCLFERRTTQRIFAGPASP